MMAVPLSFTSRVDQIYSDLRQKHIRHAKSKQDKKHNLDYTYQAYTELKEYLTRLFDHSYQNIDYFITEKSVGEYFFDMEWKEPIENVILYKDEHQQFTSVLFYGIEWILASFEVLLLVFVDNLTNNFTYAVGVTYFVQKFMKFARNSLGRSNQVNKSLIDGRFY